MVGREGLGDQKALADEIGNAIANGPHAGEAIDEGELEDELATLEQEDLDEKMLKTGTVPVLPTGPNGERTCTLLYPGSTVLQCPSSATVNTWLTRCITTVIGKGKTKAAPVEEEDEEEELRKLQAEMAM